MAGGASDQTERKGIALVQNLVVRDLDWVFREQPTSDYGIDAHVELVEGGRPSGRLLGLQIKTGDSYLKEQTEEGIIFRGKPEHLSYWLSHALPVVIVLCDLEKEVAYWQIIDKDIVASTGKGWKVIVPFTQVLDPSAADALRGFADDDEYTLRLRRLQMDRPLMELLSPDTRLLVEVMEWINKSSGRGDIKVVAQNMKGQEETVRDWPFVLLPGWSYDEALPMLFPWADLSIDEGYYEMYDEAKWQLEEGVWDSEDDKYIMLESFSDWAEGLPAGLRPYEQGDDISSWRLELQLNELGESFLTLDSFLREDLPE
jgi:hypothetical protein